MKESPQSYGTFETACQGKKPYGSFEEARAGAKWLRKNIGPKVKTYHCAHCGKWHNGHYRKKAGKQEDDY